MQDRFYIVPVFISLVSASCSISVRGELWDALVSFADGINGL